MIRYAQQMTEDRRNQMRGGEGTVTMQFPFRPGDYQSETRLFSRVTLPAGASIGYHVHEGEEGFYISWNAESAHHTLTRHRPLGAFYYILSGTAEYNDNGKISLIGEGDATIAATGQGHAIRNAGDTPLEFLAVIEPVSV